MQQKPGTETETETEAEVHTEVTEYTEIKNILLDSMF